MIKQHDLDFVDKLGMYKIYDKWPEIAETSFNSDLEEISFDGIDHISNHGFPCIKYCPKT